MATKLTESNQEYVPQSWEDVSCPFCNGTSGGIVEKYGYEHRYTLIRCSNCQLAYQNPRPRYDQDFLDTAYAVYSTSIDHYWTNGEFTKQGAALIAEYEFVISEIEELLGRKAKILDIGCAEGMFCMAAKKRGWEPTGVDVSESMIELAQTKFKLDARLGDWTKIQFDDNSFDAIHCSHVIEHIPNPQEWIQEFRRVLKPDGVLCLAIPNFQSADRIYKRFLKRVGLKKDKWAKWRTPDHLYEPAENTLVPFVEKFGFRLGKSYTYPSNFDGNPNFFQKIYHLALRRGAKLRTFFRPTHS